MKRLSLICAVAVVVLTGCGKATHAGCYAYITDGANNDDSYIVLIDSPVDAHPEWSPRPMTQEQCEAARAAGYDGKTITEAKDMAGTS